MNDPDMLREKPSRNDLLIEYLVPLSKFERLLIDELRSLLNEDDFDDKHNLQMSPEEAFGKWKWADRIKRAIEGEFDLKNMRSEHDGDRSKAYTGLLHYLKVGRLTDENVARINEIDIINPDFIFRLGEQPIEVVVVRPLDQDVPLWETIARILPSCEPFLNRRLNLSEPSNTFEILHLIKKFVLTWRLPFNRDIVLGLLINSPEFQAIYSVTAEYSQAVETQDAEELNPEEYPDAGSLPLDMAMDQQLSIVKRFAGTKELWPEDEPKYEETGGMTMAYLKHSLRMLGGYVELGDPRYYVHFIDWDDLKLVSEAELHHAQISTDVPFAHQDQLTEWFVWKPPHKGFIWNHHLHTEDEVFEYNMAHWPWPDHYLDDLVVFHAREIFGTEILGDLPNFWGDWNDCAITQRLEDDSVLLLETIPGMRFRSRCKYQDQKSAMIYFRNLVEAHAAGPNGTQYLRDALGLEATYAPVFEHSLRLIREEDLSEISWDEPLGRGANGIVFSAIYHRHPGMLASSKAAESRVSVVLKDILSRSGNLIAARKKLIKELDLTFSSLEGRSAGCVGFLGIAALKRPDDRQNSTIEERLFLVFERATQGPILNFLLDYFKGMDFLTSWDKLVDVLASIGTGIRTLHDHHVLHRDLHMNNILVTDNFIPHDTTFPHEFRYLISDVGEGKILREGIEFEHPSENLASYGAEEFRAPEVRGGEGWTPKAEVFSFGVIATKILQARRVACTAEPPIWALRSAGDTEHSSENDELVPVIFKKAIEPCLQFLAKDRVDLKKVLAHLGDLQTDFYPLFYSDIDSSSESEDAPSPSIDESNMKGATGTLDDFSLPASKPEGEPPAVTWTYWDWKRTLQLARSPKEYITSNVSDYNLDEPLVMPTLD